MDGENDLIPAHTEDTRGKPSSQRLSDMLADIAAAQTEDRITIAALLEALQGRAYGALMLVFAFPNILPTPPGTAGVLGLPLLILTAQMMMGRKPWLPAFIANRSLSRQAFDTIILHATPWLKRAEKLLRARLAPLTSATAQRVIGGICLFVTMVLVLPIPFGNMAPAIAICIIGMGVLERDGIWVIGGILAATLAVAFVGSVAYGLIKTAIFVLLNAF